MDLYTIRNLLNSGKSVFDIPMKVTYYARVSTDKDEQLHSLSAQVGYYSEFIQKNPRWTYVEGYVDEGLSATSVTKRESFLKMINDAKLGKFDFIVTKEISRFSRNTLDSIKYTQDLLAVGVGVLFQSDNINTLHADSELRLTIMSSIAQDEVRKISERVRFGFKRAIDSGVVLGSNSIYGYVKDSGKLVIVEKEAEMIRRIYDLYVNSKVGIRKISNILAEEGYFNKEGNHFSFSTIKNIISNPKYKGFYCGNKTQKLDYRRNDRKEIDSSEWVMYKDHDAVPPIVSEELWDKANRILHKRSEAMADNKTSYQNKYAYSGKIICMEHNTSYHRAEFKYKDHSREVWRCKKYSEQGKSICNSPTIYTTELDEIMRRLMNTIITDKAKIIHDMIKMYSEINAKSSLKTDISKTKVELNSILTMKDKLLDLNIKGKIDDDEFEVRNKKFNKEMADLKERIADYERQSEQNDEFQKSVEVLRGVISNELSFDDIISDGMVDSLLDRIEVHKVEEKNSVRLKVFLRVIDDSSDFDVTRKRNKPPVVTEACSDKSANAHLEGNSESVLCSNQYG
ncbi:MAG: recombinase family protein [Oscillospiraceae bacterium]|jgi:DNA invertase Pin-like site-specific DNA recombinase|nr:recombinase family protein [Oscillospiraceae bacterium]